MERQLEKKIIDHIFGEEKVEELPEELQFEIAIHEVGHWLVQNFLKMSYIRPLYVSIINTKHHAGMNSAIVSDFVMTDENFIKMMSYNMGGEKALKLFGNEETYVDEDDAGDTAKAIELVQNYQSFLNKQGNLTSEEILAKMRTLIKIANSITEIIVFENQNKLLYLAEALFKRKILLECEMQALYNRELCIDELEEIEDL